MQDLYQLTILQGETYPALSAYLFTGKGYLSNPLSFTHMYPRISQEFTVPGVVFACPRTSGGILDLTPEIVRFQFAKIAERWKSMRDCTTTGGWVGDEPNAFMLMSGPTGDQWKTYLESAISEGEQKILRDYHVPMTLYSYWIEVKK